MENVTTRGERAFPRLWAEIEADAERRTAEAAEYIERGYCEHWAAEQRNAGDTGIERYSTPTRWAQYQGGEITRAQAVEYATRRRAAQIRKDADKRRAQLDAAAAAPALSVGSIYVTWTRSRAWGYNPRAELYAEGIDPTAGTASGCGYDKESAAVAAALNSSPAALRVLYDLAEGALAAGRDPHCSRSCTGYRWADAVAYGAGYSVLPYYEGGVGVSCFWHILSIAGYIVRTGGASRLSTCYTFWLAGS